MEQGAYKLDEGLVAVGADVAHGVDDPAEGFAELDELLLGAFPRHVPQVQHLGRRLRVPELRGRPGRHPCWLGFLSGGAREPGTRAVVALLLGLGFGGFSYRGAGVEPIRGRRKRARSLRRETGLAC